MIDALITRLDEQVSVLEHRVEGAGSLADLMQRNALPQHTPAAHVLPLGLIGRAEDAGAGAYTQMFEEAVAVILTVRNHTPAGKKALADLRGIIMSIVAAIAGWAPDDQTGVFRLTRGSLLNATKGTVVYQIDFSISDQLRIFS
jgi:hypothetical protein